MSNNWASQNRPTRLEASRNRHDEGAWNGFVSFYRHYIYNIVRKLRLNHYAAEKITQKIILKLWQELRRDQVPPDRDQFHGRLCLAAWNEIKDFIHGRKRILLDTDADNERNEQTLHFLEQLSLPEIEAIAEKEWRSHVVRLAWKNLEPGLGEQQKQVFLMAEENIPAAEIAQETGLPESDVSDSRKHLQELLQKEIMRLNSQRLYI